MQDLVMKGSSAADLLAAVSLNSSVTIPASLLMLGLMFLLVFLLICVCRHKYVVLSPIWLFLLAALAGLWMYVNQKAEEQRTAFNNWHSQARAAPVLACLHKLPDAALEMRCESALFARAENLAAAITYLSEGLTLLELAKRVRTSEGEREISKLQGLLEQDPFGLVAHILTQEGCAAHGCARIISLDNRTQVQENIKRGTYQRLSKQYLEPDHRVGQEAAGHNASAKIGVVAFAPVPEKYTLPSSSSIPPVNILEDEPRTSVSPPSTVQEAPPTQSETAKHIRPKSSGNPIELKPMILMQ